MPPPADSSEQITKSELQETILATNQKLLKKQTELWRGTISDAESAWVSTVTTANTEVQAGLTDAIDQSVDALSNTLGQAIHRSDNAMERRLQQWQVTLSENARQLERQQQEMSRQTESLVQIMGQIPRMTPANRGSKEISGSLQIVRFDENQLDSADSKHESNDDGKERIEATQMTPQQWNQFLQPVAASVESVEPVGSEPTQIQSDPTLIESNEAQILKFPRPGTSDSLIESRKAA